MATCSFVALDTASVLCVSQKRFQHWGLSEAGPFVVGVYSYANSELKRPVRSNRSHPGNRARLAIALDKTPDDTSFLDVSQVLSLSALVL